MLSPHTCPWSLTDCGGRLLSSGYTLKGQTWSGLFIRRFEYECDNCMEDRSTIYVFTLYHPVFSPSYLQYVTRMSKNIFYYFTCLHGNTIYLLKYYRLSKLWMETVKWTKVFNPVIPPRRCTRIYGSLPSVLRSPNYVLASNVFNILNRSAVPNGK